MSFSLSPTRLAVALALAAGALGTGTVHAFDARAVALGGSVIAAGEGVPGALANPAALMEMQRAGLRTHISVGLGGDRRDQVGVIDVFEDNEDLLDDLEAEVDAIDAADVECEPTATLDAETGLPVSFDFEREDVCLDDLQTLGALSTQALDVFEDVDGKDVVAQGGSVAGAGFTGFAVPFALHVEARATVRGRVDVTDNDRAYVRGFETALADGELSFGEIVDSPEFDLDPEPPYPVEEYDPADPPNVDAQLPEERLDSSGNGGGIVRVTFGASFATSFVVAEHTLDVGVTPKLSNLVAAGIDAEAPEFFEDDRPSFEDRAMDSEATATSFTFDVGAAVTLERFPLRLAAVIKNVVPESIETEEGIEFETTPQLLVGGVHTRGPFSFNADLALNEAEIDSLPTQLLAVGVEFEHRFLALRGGLSHDAAREEAATALSLGLGLGAFDIGARLTDLENITVGAQVSFSF